MKKIFVAGFILIMSTYFLFIFYKDVPTTFEEFYNLDGSSQLNSISCSSTNEFSEDSDGTIIGLNELEEKKIVHGELFYDYFQNIELSKADPDDIVETENRPEFDLSLSVKSGDKITSFNIVIGKYYLLVTPMEDGGKYIYNHDLTELEYSKIVEKIDEYLK